jgi:flagellar motor switch protein FliG
VHLEPYFQEKYMADKKNMGKVLPFQINDSASKASSDGSYSRSLEAEEDARQKSCNVPKRTEVTVQFDPWSDEAWQASLTGVESDLVSELFGAEENPSSANDVTVEEMQWLLKRPFESENSLDAEAGTDPSDGLIPSGSEGVLAGLAPEQLAEAQKNGTLTQLLEYRYRKTVQFPVLDKIMSQFASGATKRLRKLTGCPCSVTPVRTVRAPFDVWLRMDHPVATSFSMFPLDGVNFVGLERDVAVGLAHALYSAGTQESSRVLLSRIAKQKKSKETCGFPIAKSVVRHLLHLLLLEMEWAFAPYYEIESIHGKSSEQAEYANYFELDQSCIVCELSVSVGDEGRHQDGSNGMNGTMMLVFPEKALGEIIPILTGKQEILVPEFAEMNASAIEKLVRLDNDTLRIELMSQHPLSAAVILSQLSEDRRYALVEKMPFEKQEAIERRAGHRAGVEVVLSESQQFVASVLALGESHAAQVLSSFSPEAAAGFLREAGKLPSLYPEQVKALLRSRNSSIVSTGALVVDSALVRRLMIRAIAAKDMAQVVALCRNDRVHMPFAPIISVPVKEIVAVLRNEPVAIQRAAIILLLRTDRDYAAQLFEEFSAAEQKEIMLQLEHEKRIEPECITLLENHLIVQLESRTEKEIISMPGKERWAVSGTVEWLLNNVSRE